MSLLQRARDAAAQAADSARQAADQARQAASQAADGEHRATLRAGMTQAGHQAREVAGLAKRGVRTAIERIDPSTLAEVVIRATALQEMANNALKDKGSPYRISGISISASVPPGVTFAIARMTEPAGAGERPSTELAAETGEGAVLALDGSVGEVTEADVEAAANEAPIEGEPAPASAGGGATGTA
ncbi:MAG TPA: hypothetical protein VEY67_07520 [Candidatus Dormibacteraeota bacterium]|nr:hypothetical protein [Candidatus Dormibacteraeota bacterium]